MSGLSPYSSTLAIIVIGTAVNVWGAAAQENGEASPNTTPDLQELADRTPDGSKIVEFLKNARMTFVELGAANQTIEQEISKLRFAENALSRLHGEIVATCKVDHPPEMRVIRTIAMKSQLLDHTLADIEPWLKSSIDAVRKSSDPTKVHKRNEYFELEEAYSAYGRLRVSARATTDSLEWLAANIPIAIEGCEHIVLPPFDGSPVQSLLPSESRVEGSARPTKADQNKSALKTRSGDKSLSIVTATAPAPEVPISRVEDCPPDTVVGKRSAGTSLSPAPVPVPMPPVRPNQAAALKRPVTGLEAPKRNSEGAVPRRPSAYPQPFYYDVGR